MNREPPIPLDNLEQFLGERMRAYLAGPLTGCDARQLEMCRTIRVRARRVLRSRFTVYDPADITPPGTDHTADDVFREDHTRTSTADLVFFHVNAPSLGVGIESQIAAEATIPRVIAVPRGVRISRMFEGVFNPTIAHIEYTDADDFEQQLLKLLPSIADRVAASADKRRPVIAAIRNAHIGREIFQARVLLRKTIDELARATDIRQCMLRRLEREEAVAGTLTVIQLKRLAQELGGVLTISGEHIPTLHGPADDLGVTEIQQKSLASLYQFLRTCGEEWVPDDVVFELWEWAFPSASALAARHFDEPLTVEEWRAEYQNLRSLDDSEGELFLFGG